MQSNVLLRSLLPLFIASFSLGCDATPTDAGEEGDTGEDGDTGEEGDTGAPTEHPCPDYFGYHPTDAAFTYDYKTDFGLSGTITRQLEAVDGAEVRVREHELSTWRGGDTESHSRLWTYQCDGVGVSLVSMESSGESTYDGEAIPQTYELRYDPPALLIPADLAVGSEWSTVYKGTETYNGERMRVDDRYDWVAVEETTVTVPAGEFAVLFVDGEGNGEDLTGDLWLERSVGLVRSQYERLASY